MFDLGMTTEVDLPPLTLSLEAYERWLKSFMPLMGADDDDDSNDDDSDDDSSNDDVDDSADDSDDDSDEDSDDDSDDDDDGDDEATKKLKAENKALLKRVGKAEHAAREAKKAARDAKAAAASSSGDWEKLAKEREAEIEDLNERLSTTEAERNEATTNLDKFQRTVRVSNIATRLGFKDPEDAMRLVDTESTGDDKSAERALRNLAKEKDYLVDQRRATGRSGLGGGNGDGGLLTKEQMDRMTPAEVAAADPDLINKSLAALKPGGG